MIRTPALRATVKILILLAGLNTVYFGWILAKRLQLPYNEAGRYDDPATGIVIQQQSIIAILIMFGLGVLLTLGLVVFNRKLKN